ncbi:hypothetical protein [Amycolatopsis sp. cmx-11-12]|uniref:hypothetical protein n=1 Tax=Amycolatopsis sp. cmx-11-12 TaxID=2785795 RepID=UPI00391844BF
MLPEVLDVLHVVQEAEQQPIYAFTTHQASLLWLGPLFGAFTAVARFVTVMMVLVIGLVFLFGFGNVLNLALKLQVPVFVAPLVVQAVDLTVLGLLVGTRHLALFGASDDVLRSARRLLLAASAVTLLLNVADPVCAGPWGKAAFDAVGPLLLIGWAETCPGLLRALSAVNSPG